MKYYIVDAILLVLFFVLGIAVGLHYNPSAPQSITVDSGITVATTTEPTIDVTTILNRLDALDGGQEKRWSCANVPQSFITYYGGPSDTKIIVTATTTLVIKTIGAETPEQLGYLDCTPIKKADWPITIQPINQ